MCRTRRWTCPGRRSDGGLDEPRAAAGGGRADGLPQRRARQGAREEKAARLLSAPLGSSLPLSAPLGSSRLLFAPLGPSLPSASFGLHLPLLGDERLLLQLSQPGARPLLGPLLHALRAGALPPPALPAGPSPPAPLRRTTARHTQPRHTPLSTPRPPRSTPVHPRRPSSRRQPHTSPHSRSFTASRSAPAAGGSTASTRSHGSACARRREGSSSSRRMRSGPPPPHASSG